MTIHPAPLRMDQELGGPAFHALQSIVARETGIHLPESKRMMLQARLAGRLTELGLSGIEDFLAGIAAGDAQLRDTLITCVTTNVTAFFREAHHFSLLENRILPPLLPGLADGGRLRLWSAGCSTGEEPYSMAASLHKLTAGMDAPDVRILATDIDRRVLQTAEAAIYPPDRQTRLPVERRNLLFAADRPNEIRAAIRQLVRFRPLNLNGDWPMRGPFDAIFCRNVAIYFPRETQEALWLRFAALLRRGGWLILGHSERLTGPAACHFRCEDVTAYRKVD